MNSRVRWPRGQSAVELALVTPILIVLLLVAADFGRVFYTSIAVNNAARAGAQYGSHSIVTAANSAGITAAARTTTLVLAAAVRGKRHAGRFIDCTCSDTSGA